MSSAAQWITIVQRFRRWSGLSIAAMMIFTAGCAGTADDIPLRQRLDETTGATVTSLAEPLAFFREEPMLAANSRDYVYIGPVEIDRSGRREYLLWATYCSTIDRIGRPAFRAPDAAYLMLDGEPMELVRAAGQGDSGSSLYDSPIAGGEHVVYRVTRDQLLAIARAREISIVAQGSESAVREFGPWRESRSDWQRFSRYLDGSVTSSMALVRE